MALLVLPNVTLRIPIWYRNPPTNTLPGQPRSYHTLTLVQLVPMTPATASVPSQPQQEPTSVVKASSQGGKAKRKDSEDKAPNLLQPLRPQSWHPRVLCGTSLGMPPTIVPNFLNLNHWFMKCSLSWIFQKFMLTYRSHVRNSKHFTKTIYVPFVTFMITIPIVSLVSMSFVIEFRRLVTTRPIVVEPLLLYLWILVPLVN